MVDKRDRAELARQFLDSIKDRSLADLNEVEYLARLGARQILRRKESCASWRMRNTEKNRENAREWGKKNPERRKINDRIWTLRQAIHRLAGKKISPRGVDWNARRIEYERELEELLQKRAELYGI